MVQYMIYGPIATLLLAAAPAPELLPIARLESANGVLLNHRPSPRGAFYTAFGLLGLKPSTAYEEYRLSPRLQRRFPTSSASDFLEQFTTNDELYNAVALQHWAKLRRLAGGDLRRVAYGWHLGQTAMTRASEGAIAQDQYSARYAEYAATLWAGR